MIDFRNQLPMFKNPNTKIIEINGQKIPPVYFSNFSKTFNKIISRFHTENNINNNAFDESIFHKTFRQNNEYIDNANFSDFKRRNQFTSHQHQNSNNINNNNLDKEINNCKDIRLYNEHIKNKSSFKFEVKDGLQIINNYNNPNKKLSHLHINTDLFNMFNNNINNNNNFLQRKIIENSNPNVNVNKRLNTNINFHRNLHNINTFNLYKTFYNCNINNEHNKNKSNFKFEIKNGFPIITNYKDVNTNSIGNTNYKKLSHLYINTDILNDNISPKNNFFKGKILESRNENRSLNKKIHFNTNTNFYSNINNISNINSNQNTNNSNIISTNPNTDHQNKIILTTNTNTNNKKTNDKLTNIFQINNTIKKHNSSKIVFPIKLYINHSMSLNKNNKSKDNNNINTNRQITKSPINNNKKSSKNLSHSVEIKNSFLSKTNNSKNKIKIKPPDILNNTMNFKYALTNTNLQNQKLRNMSPLSSLFLSIKDNFNQNNLIVPPSTPKNYYNKSYYYYIIYNDNNGNLIKQCMAHRLKWKESHSLNTLKYNFKWKDCSNNINYVKLSKDSLSQFKTQIVNHYEYHSSLSNKAKMFSNLLSYCESINKEVFQYVPFTIIIDLTNQLNYTNYVEEFKNIFDNISNYIYDYETIRNKKFIRNKIPYSSIFKGNRYEIKRGYKTNILIPSTHYSNKNYWIVKVPNLNRGRCIKLINNAAQVKHFINSIYTGECSGYLYSNSPTNNSNNTNTNNNNSSNNTNNNNNNSSNTNKKLEELKQGNTYSGSIIIIQKYIEQPLLYYKRKFDIRIWVLITHKFDVFAFKEGHLKACSVSFNINDINDIFIHLTNYSLQKYNDNFSKYEKGNEISFEIFQNYLNEINKKTENNKTPINIRKDIFPKFKEIIELTIRSVKNKININNNKHCFEIFGYDFMMDVNYNVFLIEVNTNPGLEESSDLIKVLVPRMIDDALRLTIDDLFPTDYDSKWVDSNGNYNSNYHVDGYSDGENLWEFVCNANKDNNFFNIYANEFFDVKKIKGLRKKFFSRKKKNRKNNNLDSDSDK